MTEHDTQDSVTSLPDKNERVGGQAEEASWLKTSKNGWNLQKAAKLKPLMFPRFSHLY